MNLVHLRRPGWLGCEHVVLQRADAQPVCVDVDHVLDEECVRAQRVGFFGARVEGARRRPRPHRPVAPPAAPRRQRVGDAQAERVAGAQPQRGRGHEGGGALASAGRQCPRAHPQPPERRGHVRQLKREVCIQHAARRSQRERDGQLDTMYGGLSIGGSSARSARSAGAITLRSAPSSTCLLTSCMASSAASCAASSMFVAWPPHWCAPRRAATRSVATAALEKRIVITRGHGGIFASLGVTFSQVTFSWVARSSCGSQRCCCCLPRQTSSPTRITQASGRQKSENDGKHSTGLPRSHPSLSSAGSCSGPASLLHGPATLAGNTFEIATPGNTISRHSPTVLTLRSTTGAHFIGFLMKARRAGSVAFCMLPYATVPRLHLAR